MKNLKKVIALHDFEESSRIGMQDRCSRYLISIEKIKEAIKFAIQGGVSFDAFENDYFNHSKTEITHDDGGGSALLLAEFLKSADIRGRFFIATKFIGNDNFLKNEEIKYIHSLGHVIGTHSHTHPNPFCELDESRIINEVLESKSILEEIIKEKILTLAIPGGEVRRATFQILAQKKIGINYIYTSMPYKGAYCRLNNCEFIGRLCIERNMNVNQIEKFLLGNGWFANRLNYQIRRMRREVIYKYNSFKGN